MEKFKLSTEGYNTIINVQSTGLKIKVEKNRELEPEDYGALIDVIQYKDKFQFEQVASYVFEGITIDADRGPTNTERSHFFDAIVFYFGAVVGSPNYRITIPEFSSFYDEPIPQGFYGKFIKEGELGPELTTDNLSLEALKILGNTGEVDDEKLPF